MFDHLLSQRRPSTGSTAVAPQGVTVRRAVEEDGATLARLAALDSAEPVALPALIAEADGRAVAAVALADGRATADPFAPTADLVALLRLRARQLDAPARARGVALRRRLRLAGVRP